MERTENRRILDVIFIVLLFALSTGFHNYYMTFFMQEVTDVHSLIQNSAIGSAPVESLFYLPHMGAGVYHYVLRLLFYIMGNKLLTAVVFQMFLKMAGLFVLYFALRMAVGRAGAFVTTAILLFFPMQYGKLFELNPVYLTVLVCSLLLLFLGGLLQGNRKQGFHKFSWFIVFVFYGILCGAAAWLDILGAAVWIVSVVWILLVNRHGDREGFRNGYVQAGCIFLGGAICVVGLGCLVSAGYGLSFEAPYFSYLSHLQEVWNGDCMEYLYAGILLAGIVPGAILQLIVSHFRPVKKEHVEETDKIVDLNVQTQEDALEEELSKTGPLDNPLPLPKKHEPRRMEFVKLPDDVEMNFDIDVPKGEDDFDIS